MQTREFFVIQQLGPLSDWWMLAMVGGIVLIDVALLTAWEVADPLEWEQYNFTEKVRKINENSQKDKWNEIFAYFFILNYWSLWSSDS